jgi:hypothetical protein
MLHYFVVGMEGTHKGNIDHEAALTCQFSHLFIVNLTFLLLLIAVVLLRHWVRLHLTLFKADLDLVQHVLLGLQLLFFMRAVPLAVLFVGGVLHYGCRLLPQAKGARFAASEAGLAYQGRSRGHEVGPAVLLAW